MISSCSFTLSTMKTLHIIYKITKIQKSGKERKETNNIIMKDDAKERTSLDIVKIGLNERGDKNFRRKPSNFDLVFCLL